MARYASMSDSPSGRPKARMDSATLPPWASSSSYAASALILAPRIGKRLDLCGGTVVVLTLEKDVGVGVGIE